MRIDSPTELFEKRFRVTTAFLLVALILAHPSDQTYAEDQTKPVIRTMIGALLLSQDHIYVAESSVFLPIVRDQDWGVSYQYHEVTPVFKEGPQTQLLSTRNQAMADFNLSDHFRLIGLGGYHHTAFQDRAGSLGAYELGIGIGSPLTKSPSRLEWAVAAGGYLGREQLNADWWADIHLAWRTFEFSEGQLYETSFRPWLGLAADIQSANEGDRFQALYSIGPVFEMMSANGNRVRFLAQWRANDGNPFFETRSSGLLLGAEVSASLDQETLFDARDRRPIGWLPLVYGQYDVGYGGERSLQRTELTAEIHDLKLADHVFTALLWYESRQELRTGDYDNVSYTVSFGVQSRVGLTSILSQGQPLVAGIEYVHRSAHALDPDPDRVPPPQVLEHNSLNLTPRLRLQTLGWDLPYRDPSIYQARTDWLNRFDWRVTLGYDTHHSRDRSNPAGQLGLNWDVATLHGHVFYLRGLGSIGNETPDSLGEVGVRRPIGKLFFRYERLGLEGDLAQGDLAVVGIGFHL